MHGAVPLSDGFIIALRFTLVNYNLTINDKYYVFAQNGVAYNGLGICIFHDNNLMFIVKSVCKER